MNFDEILSRHLGEIGRFQIIVVAVLCLEEFFMPMVTLIPVFIAAVPEFWCDNSHDNSQLTLSHLNTTFPEVRLISNASGQIPVDHCQLHPNITDVPGIAAAVDTESDRCLKWQYSQERYTSTIVSEWDLVCDRAWLVGTASAVFMAGRGTGSIIFAYLADRFGRRYIVLGAGLLNVACSLACAAAPNITFFLVMRFVLANFSTAKTNCNFVLATEYVGPTWRVFSGNIYFFFWCVGYIVLAGLAYLIREWRILIIVSCTPEIIFYILFYFFVPESPRWLLSRNRHAEAKAVMIRMAKVNRVDLPEELELQSDDKNQSTQKQRSYTIVDLFRTPQLRMLSLNIIFNWFSEGIVYYGLSLNTSNLGGNPYLNFAIAGAVEIPAYLLIPLVCKYLGRILPFSGCLILGGVALLATAPIPADMMWLIITLSMIGKFFISASFSIIWTYCCEAYPTCIRNQGLTVTAVAARTSSVVASYVGLLAGINTVLPLLVFGAFAFTAGLLVLILPETKDQALKKSIEEAEVFIKTNKLWSKKKVDDEDVRTDNGCVLTDLLQAKQC